MFSGGRKEAGMGIFIDLYIAEDVTDEEWAPVYEESLKLAEAFHLMDSQAPEMYGHRLVCGIPSGQKGGEQGWRAVGDSVTMGRAEEQSLPAKLSGARDQSAGGTGPAGRSAAAGGKAEAGRSAAAGENDPAGRSGSPGQDDPAGSKSLSGQNGTGGKGAHGRIILCGRGLDGCRGGSGRRFAQSVVSDPLLAAAPGRTMLDFRDPRCEGGLHFWGNKTQGEAYHIYLLAIGCMIEDRLEGRACVDGDITIGQCRRAVRMATRYLDRPVRLPARCVPERLYRRIRSLPLKKQETLNVFHNLYLGELDGAYGSFIREHFSREEQSFFWKREFRGLRIGSPGFASALRDYLNLGNSLEDLCRYVQFVDRDGTEYYQAFVEALMKSKLFLKKKDLRDCLEIDREEEVPYSIYTLLAQFALSGAKNYSVNRYIPPEEIRETLERFIGGYCDVRGIMADHLKRAAQKEPSSLLNDLMDKKMENLRKRQEMYDICEYRELLQYEPGARIEPGMEEHCRKFLDFYRSLCGEECFERLMKGTAEEKNAFLVSQNADIFLMEEKWKKIFADVEACPEHFRRYYPMVRIQGDENGRWVICAYVSNDALYRHFEEGGK